MIRTASLFSQILQHIPEHQFNKLVARHGAEKSAKGFKSRTQLVAMLFCHLEQAESLGEISNGLKCCLGKLQHLGVDKAPPKSTLSYANMHRPAIFFQDLFFQTLDRFRSSGMLGEGKHRFRFNNKLLIMDSSVIALCLSLYPWAEYKKIKGGVKLHVLLDCADYMPSFVNISTARTHDLKVARLLNLSPGSIIAIDKGYTDYTLFSRWTEHGIFFVTRLRDNAVYEVIEDRKIPANSNIMQDRIIKLTGAHAEEKCPHPLRLVLVWDPVNERIIKLLTNHLQFGSTTIASIYKERWQIEVFFKTLKQNLKIKSFVGTSENAILTQIWTALLALLILKWLRHLSKATWSFTTLAAMLRMNLFTYRDLYDWLDDPFNTPPLDPVPEQLSLPLKHSGQLNLI